MGFKEFWSWFSGSQPTQPDLPAGEGIHESTGKRKLTSGLLLFILINSILGSSLFYLPGLGVISSGAASILAWAFVFIVATFVMLYMGELVTMLPTSGGTYYFCKKAYGRLGSFMAGWLIWIAGNFGMALNLVAAAEYFIPEQTQAALYLRIGFALLWVIVLNFMAFRGIDAGSTMLVIFGFIATVVVAGMILPSFIDIPNLFAGKLTSPFDLELFKPFFRHEGSGILAFLGLSVLLISEAFLGFEVISYMANEAAEPKKLHKVLLKGMVICGLIMVLYIFSSLGTVGYRDYVTNARPFAVQAFNTMGQVGQNIVVFGMYLVILGAAAAWPITGSRLIRAMSKDKLFLKQFASLHQKYRSPHRAVYFQTIMVALFSWFIFRGYLVKWSNPYRTIYLVYVLLSLIVLSLILLTVPILRRKEPLLERPFKAPLATFGPIIIVLGIFGLVFNWIRLEGGVAQSIIQLALSFLAVGLPFYFSVEMFYNPQAIKSVNERFSSIFLLGEKLLFPVSVRKRVLRDIVDVNGKHILEFGCSGGSLTEKLAELVSVKGRVHAVDLSLKKVNAVAKKLKHLPHVNVYHHPYLDDFKLSFEEPVDGIVSVGMLSYMQNPLKILTKLSNQVKQGGEIVFVDFDKFFYFFPNISWVENDGQIKSLFKKAGFSVNVFRERSLFWQYIFVVGTKD